MKIFCVGIGGIGLSGVAKILVSQGHEVLGSDSSGEALRKHFPGEDIRTFDVHSGQNIDESLDLVIYSEAVPSSNPERMRASELGIRQMNYAEALAMISKGKKTIAVAGTHGKTTTTGMLTSILLTAKEDPTIVIGSTINILGNQNYRVGKGEWFLAEACEYRDNFLTLDPSILLITNLEPDHLDYFKTVDRYYQSYQKLIEKLPPEGWLVMSKDDTHLLDLSKVKARVKLLSKEQCRKVTYPLKVPGEHNHLNAYAAEAVAQLLDISGELIERGLSEFTGTGRRFEYKGELNGAKCYDDYGHHPTEIAATLQAAREWFPDKKLILVFQPHQYSRTRELFNDFTRCFSQASEVWITDIYQARDTEDDIKSVSAQRLIDAIEGVSALYVTYDEIAQKMESVADPYTVFLVMGAGNISRVFHALGNLKKE